MSQQASSGENATPASFLAAREVDCNSGKLPRKKKNLNIYLEGRYHCLELTLRYPNEVARFLRKRILWTAR